MRSVFFVCLSLIACSSEEELPPSDVSGIPLDDLCTELAEVDCDRLDECGSLSDLSEDLCRVRQEQVFCAPSAAALKESVAANELTYFELSARACRDAIAELDCAVGLDHDLFTLAACREMVAPADPPTSCHTYLACPAGFYCDPGDSCPGTCESFRTNNEACGPEPCAAGFFCSATARRCRAQVASNANCELSIGGNSCTAGFYCDTAQPGGYVCRPVRGAQSGCNSPYECVVGMSCIRNKCSDGAEGTLCTDKRDCQAGLVCALGACHVPLLLDAECQATGSAVPCAAGLVCTSSAGASACTHNPLDGEPCPDDTCYLARCAGEFCVPLVADGDPCGSSGECLPNRTCSEDRCQLTPRSCVE